LPAGELLRRAPRVDRAHRNWPTGRRSSNERYLSGVLAGHAIQYSARRPHRTLQLRPPSQKHPSQSRFTARSVVDRFSVGW